jgi:hypothetical protein
MNSDFSLLITKAVKIEQAAICLCTIAWYIKKICTPNP